MPTQENNNTPVVKRYYPVLSDIISTDNIPEVLNFIEEFLGKIHYKDLQFNKSARGDAAFYSLTLIYPGRLAIGFSGVSLVLNPDLSGDSKITAFPITIEYRWKILAFLRSIKLQELNVESLSAQNIFEFALRALNINEEQAIANIINTFVTITSPQTTLLQQFVADIEDFAGIELSEITEETTLREIVEEIFSETEGIRASLIAFGAYLLNEDPEIIKHNLKLFFRSFLPDDIEEYIKDLLIPYFKATLTLNGAIEFSRELLTPLYDKDGINPYDGSTNHEPYDIIPPNSSDPDSPRVLFPFGKVLLSADSKNGLAYQAEFELNSLTPALIGRTGFIVNISKLKVDLSDSSVLREASEDGRENFKGLYIGEATILLPKDWSAEGSESNVEIIGRDLLIGTGGGFSGKIGVEGNGNLHFKLFDDIEIDFSSFNIEFKQNSVLSSDIKGKIAINGLKDSTGQDAILDFTIDWTEDGYSIKVENSKGIQLKVPNVLDITLYSLSIGKINGKWEFKSKGKIDRVRDIPVIGSIIPRTIDFEKFNLNQGAANDYDIDIKWDNDVVAKIDENGLGLEHEETIHINKTFLKIFTLHLMKLKISTNAQNSSVDIQALIDADLELKPIFAKARGGGLKAEISFPEGGGNLGPVDIQFSFVTPTSMGVKIKIPGIEGQGYLDKDPVEEKYAGMLHLEIQKKLKITAIGILNMKLPSGKAGFSIIGIATVEFDPAIDITAGLKLSGIGALFGLNRSMDISALQSSLRNDTLQHLMFPEDPIKNAPTKISTMGSVFPVHEGQFTFGLLLKAYWGGEKLVQLKLGLLVEVPDPVKIAIAGILQLNLPDETNPLIKINAAFLAAVDFEAKKFALDARIFDSKIMNISISGDIVARYYWGANSGFLLSIGGFHPSYTPPQMDLPSKINRLALSFIDEPKRRLKGTFYMAVTSNSVQFGAALDLYVSIALGYNLKANFSLDVLIYTKPQFSFIAEMHISAGVYKGNKNKPAAGVSISMSLQGPNPYHVKGRGSVSIGPLDVSANFNFQIGKEKQIAASSVNVFVLLAAQLNNNYTWQAIMPDVNVNMREIDLSELDENSLLLHPMGSLQVKQGIVPLNIQIKCYGNSTIDGSDKLWIQNAKIGQTLLNIVPTKDKFAPNQFFNISDNQKLTSPSFNDYEDGVEIGGVDVIESSCVRTKNADYEPIIIDREFTYPRPSETIDVARHNDLLNGGAVASAPIAKQNPNQHFIGQEEQISPSQDGFVLLFAEDYSEVATELTFATYDEAMNSLQVFAWDMDLFESEIIIEHRSVFVTF